MWGRLNSRNMGVEGKVYIVLYACSLSYAWYMDLVSSLETREFILSLKKLIAKKGRPQKIYLDHGSIFEGATWWLRKAMCDEKLPPRSPTSSQGCSLAISMGKVCVQPHTFTCTKQTF